MLKKIILFGFFFILSLSVLASGKNVAKDKKIEKPTFVVYYFYAQPRCQTCRAIEINTGLAVSKYFDNELKAGLLKYKAVDVGKPENKHFIKDFKLYTKSVVLVKKVNNKVVRYQILPKVWQFIHSPEEFELYIENSVRDFIERGLKE